MPGQPSKDSRPYPVPPPAPVERSYPDASVPGSTLPEGPTLPPYLPLHSQRLSSFMTHVHPATLTLHAAEETSRSSWHSPANALLLVQSIIHFSSMSIPHFAKKGCRVGSG